MFRVEVRGQADSLLSIKEQTLKYLDFFVFYHVPEGLISKELSAIVDSITRYGRVAIEESCNFATPGKFAGYSPFVVQETDNRLRIDPKIQVFTRRTTALVQPGRFELAPDHAIALTVPNQNQSGPSDVAPPGNPMAQSSLSGPTGVDVAPPPLVERRRVLWKRNFYPWVVGLDFAATKAGEAVFAVDKIDCNKHGNFIVGSTGAIASPEQSTAADADAMAVSRQQMIAADVNYGASHNPNDETIATGSVDPKGFWCIPTVEFCYGQVDFGMYDIKAKENDISKFRPSNVVSLRNGIAAALARIVMDNCPQEDMEASEGK